MNVNNYLLSILLQASTLIGYMIAACLIPRVKRRKQFLLSCAFMGVSQVLLGFSLKFTVSNNLVMKCYNVDILNENFRKVNVNCKIKLDRYFYLFVSWQSVLDMDLV